MARFVVVDQKDNDCFSTECDTMEQAIMEADNQWGLLTNAEKKSRIAFYILESVNPDEEAVDHFDGNIVKNYK